MSWYSQIFRRRSVYSDLSDEIREHLEEKTEQLMRVEGLSRRDAEQASRRAFGNVALIEERGRAAWQWPTLESMWADFKFALRQLRKSPGFACTVVATLALGIGANTAVFSILDAVLLRPLPYAHADRLVVIWQTDAAHRSTGAWFNAYREFEEWQGSSKSFEQLAALSWATRGTTTLVGGKPVDILPIPASVNFFAMLGVQPLIGRTFTSADLANSCTLVLSHRFWQQKLGGRHSVVGESLVLDRTQCAVVGVMPESFSFYPTQTDAWTLITPASEYVKQPSKAMTGVFGLLKPGVTRLAAQAELDAIEKRILPEMPDLRELGVATPDVLDLQANFTWLAGRNLRNALWMLLGAVALVLLMASVNVANLLLGRAIDRGREMAIRSALGSGRRRLVRQLLTEAVLLSCLGTGAGIMLALLLLRWFHFAHPVELPPGNSVVIHWHVLCFTAAIGAGAAILFGLLPALRGSRVDLNTVLKAGERGVATSPSAHRISQTLVAAQMAVSLMLVAGAGLLVESLWRLASTPVGYRTDRLLTAWINLPENRYKTPSEKYEFFTRFAEKVSTLPGVQAVAGASNYYPAGGDLLLIEGQAKPPAGHAAAVPTQTVSASFFRTMDIALLLGRSFDTRDRADTQPVAMVNEALAEKYFPHGDAIGRAIKLGTAADGSAQWMTIVGVVANVKTTTVFQEMGYIVEPTVYRPLAQDAPASLLVSAATVGDPLQIVDEVQHQLQSVDPELILGRVETMAEIQSAVLSQPRFRTLVLGSFAGLALALAALGVYGLLAQGVVQRRREIGIRMALGASREHVLYSVLRDAYRTVLAGLFVGIVGAGFAVRALASLLYAARAENAAIFAVSSGVLLLAATVAAWLPARRAASIDPMQALRTE